MADEIDRAQEREQFDRDLALQAHSARMHRGAPECSCGEPITELRQSLGAIRCIDCQLIHESGV